jgi:hypothetical protein
MVALMLFQVRAVGLVLNGKKEGIIMKKVLVFLMIVIFASPMALSAGSKDGDRCDDDRDCQSGYCAYTDWKWHWVPPHFTHSEHKKCQKSPN